MKTIIDFLGTYFFADEVEKGFGVEVKVRAIAATEYNAAEIAKAKKAKNRVWFSS